MTLRTKFILYQWTALFSWALFLVLLGHIFPPSASSTKASRMSIRSEDISGQQTIPLLAPRTQ